MVRGSAEELATVLIETYSVNDRMNQHLLANLSPHAWRAELPGTGKGGGPLPRFLPICTTAGWYGLRTRRRI